VRGEGAAEPAKPPAFFFFLLVSGGGGEGRHGFSAAREKEREKIVESHLSLLSFLLRTRRSCAPFSSPPSCAHGRGERKKIDRTSLSFPLFPLPSAPISRRFPFFLPLLQVEIEVSQRPASFLFPLPPLFSVGGRRGEESSGARFLLSLETPSRSCLPCFFLFFLMEF